LIIPIDGRLLKVTMPAATSTILDQISAQKTKISERLARLDADREKIATQLTDLETAERVLTRVGNTPPGRRPRSLKWRALSSEGLSISLPERLDGRSVRMLCAVALRPLLGVGDRGHIDGSAAEARGLITGVEQRCRGAIVW
jgi:hypothetical protein